MRASVSKSWPFVISVHAQARRDYREWAEDEHRLWTDFNGEFGIDAAEYAAAIARADTATEQ